MIIIRLWPRTGLIRRTAGLRLLLFGEVDQLFQLLDDRFLNVTRFRAGIPICDSLLCGAHAPDGAFEGIFLRVLLSRLSAEQSPEKFAKCSLV